MSYKPQFSYGEKSDLREAYSRQKQGLEAAEYTRIVLQNRLKLAQGIALCSLGYAILTTIAIALLLIP